MTATRLRLLGLGGLLVGMALAAAACGGGRARAGGNLSVRIVSPANGATVSEPFTLKIQASVPLGEPSTGKHHVHVCFDGQSCSQGSYSLVYGNSFSVTGLSPGRHTIEASLRNADHSDTGVSDTIMVTVAGGGRYASPTPTSGYGY